MQVAFRNVGCTEGVGLPVGSYRTPFEDPGTMNLGTPKGVWYEPTGSPDLDLQSTHNNGSMPK